MLTGTWKLLEIWDALGTDFTLFTVVTVGDDPCIGFALGRHAGAWGAACCTREAYWGAAAAASQRRALHGPRPPGAPEHLCIQLALADRLPRLDQ